MVTRLGGRISSGQMREAARGDQVRAMNPSRNWGALGLSIARVRDVYYEEMKADLLIVSGEDDTYIHEGVDLTFPGSGKRHFFGSMPERGDFCIVGWAVQESIGIANSRVPIILTWIPPPTWMGYEWLMHQGYTPGEGMDTPQQRALLLGISERTRYKLRHIGPGNIVASSSQGSDLVLDEGVLLTNRRANEIRLRDQDQAFIVRSLQQFHAMAGARIYAGMVQREARLLPTTMFSDGIWWDAPLQMGDEEPLGQDDLGVSAAPRNFLTPGQIFQRSDASQQSDFADVQGNPLPSFIDPFRFLQWGAFITSEGNRSDSPEPTAVYGGKALYRVGLIPGTPSIPTYIQNTVAGTSETNPDALTEYRIEVTHTSKGILPVTEQTDGFDAERLPQHDLSSEPSTYPSNTPFIEWVLGSVVGNDAFTVNGRGQYGIPLKPVIFLPNGTAAPALVSGMNSSIGDHAATLLKVRPPVGTRPPSFTSFTKAGNFKANIQGNAPWSIEVFTANGIKLQTGGALSISAASLDLNIGSGPGLGVNIGSPQGATRIYGMGRATAATAGNEAAGGSTDNDNSPSVLIEGRYNVNLNGGTRIGIQAPTVDITNTTQVNIRAQTGIEMQSGDSITMHSNTHTVSIAGSASYQFSGPTGANPTNGPLRRTVFSGSLLTGHTGGDTDTYHMEFGDRVEEFVIGNHITRITTRGDFTYSTELGDWNCRAAQNTTVLSGTSGANTTIVVGDAVTEVRAGSARLQASAEVNVKSLIGAVTVTGTTGVTLKSFGTATGAIMCGTDQDPLTGIQYRLLGLTPRGQQLGTL